MDIVLVLIACVVGTVAMVGALWPSPKEIKYARALRESRAAKSVRSGVPIDLDHV